MNENSYQEHDQLDEVIKASRKKYFPMTLPEGVEARHVSSKECGTVYQKYVKTVFTHGLVEEMEEVDLNEGMRNRKETINPLYNRYDLLHSDNILFYNQSNQPIGWMFGETEDAETFYMRNTGILEEYQNKGIYTSFLKQYLQYLKEIGYERVTSHHSGTNKAVLIPKLKLGFEICGMELHEVFGPNLKMVYIFHRDRKAIYYRKYGHKKL